MLTKQKRDYRRIETMLNNAIKEAESKGYSVKPDGLYSTDLGNRKLNLLGAFCLAKGVDYHVYFSGKPIPTLAGISTATLKIVESGFQASGRWFDRAGEYRGDAYRVGAKLRNRQRAKR